MIDARGSADGAGDGGPQILRRVQAPTQTRIGFEFKAGVVIVLQLGAESVSPRGVGERSESLPRIQSLSVAHLIVLVELRFFSYRTQLLLVKPERRETTRLVKAVPQSEFGRTPGQ